MNQQEIASPQVDSNQQPHNRVQHPLANYQFSYDELRVLRECNTESFFQRSLPIGTGFGLAAYFGTKQGYLKPNIKYGAVPKVVVSVIVGYFLGKFSYQQKCSEKIMKLPNSKLAEVIRQRKQGSIMNTLTSDNIGSSLVLSPFTPNVSDIYSDEYASNRPNNSFEMDVDSRPSISGLDDTYRPSLDNPSKDLEPEIPIEPAKTGTTYDELRQRNREEYLKKQQSSRPPQLSQEHYLVRAKEKSMPESESETAKSKRETNKYGDIWTN